MLEALRKSLDKGPFVLHSPFDTLRANGSGFAFVKFLPFVLSLSQHGVANGRGIRGFPRAFESSLEAGKTPALPAVFFTFTF